MRIGIAGLGSIAQRVYLPLLCNRQDLEIVGLMSRSTATVTQAGRTYRIDAVFTDLGDLLSRRPDLVFVHAPTAAHPEIIRACLTAGAAVYVDKPLAYTIADCEELAVRAAAAGLLLAVGFNRRFAPMYVRARDWITAEGGLRLAGMEKHRAVAPIQTAREAVYDDLIHVLDTLLWLIGEEAEALPADLRVDRTAGFRLAMGALRTPMGSASYAMIRSVGADLERLTLHADGRSAEVIDLERTTFDGPDGRQVATFSSWDTVVERRGFTALVQHVLDTVGTPERCQVAAARVTSTHRLAESIVANS